MTTGTDRAHDLTVMVPALNEQANLEATVDNVLRAGRAAGLRLDVVIVNDGSTDRTPEMADRLAAEFEPVRVLHHRVNLGLGVSVRELLPLAWGEKFMIVPGDNDMSYELVLAMFENCHTADLVLCFYLNREMRGRVRNALSAAFGVVYMTMFDLFVQYINAPCVYPTRVLQGLHLISTRFTIPPEMTIKTLKQGVTFFEVPGYMQTGARNSSSLNFRSLREVMGTFVRLVWEINWSRRSAYARRPVRQLIPLQTRQAAPAACEC